MQRLFNNKAKLACVANFAVQDSGHEFCRSLDVLLDLIIDGLSVLKATYSMFKEA